MIAVLDYGIGNLRSAQKALQRVGADAVLTDDAAIVADAAAVVLPGVGAFGRCMEALRETGLADVAVAAIADGRPFLGVCIGLQMLYESSDETPDVPGLGVLRGRVRRLPDGVKRPQMQWNVVRHDAGSRLFEGLQDPIWMYFVHSFAPDDTPDAVARCNYGGQVVAAVERGNLWGTQFHPEKSGAPGLRLLANFAAAAAAP